MFRPVNRQKEEEIARYYRWPIYWEAGYPGTMVPTMPSIPAIMPMEGGEMHNSHLRSVKEVLGYRIRATDGDIGHVVDFIIDDDKWNIGFLVVDAGTWLSGRKVLIALQWIAGISWGERNVRIELSKDEIRQSPHYDPDDFLHDDYIKRLHEHYERARNRA